MKIEYPISNVEVFKTLRHSVFMILHSIFSVSAGQTDEDIDHVPDVMKNIK